MAQLGTITLLLGLALAVYSAVGSVVGPDGEFSIGSGGTGQITHKLREKLVGIQTGAVADASDWVMKL